MKSTATLRRLFGQSWLAIVLVAVLWMATENSQSLYFPPFSQVLANLWDQILHGTLQHDIWYSLGNLLLGLAIATVVGVLSGLIIGEHPRLRVAASPVLDFLRATPHVALVPVILLTLGLGAEPRVFLIAFGCVWAIMLNTISGVQGIPAAVRETARSYRIPWVLRMRKVIIPGAAPQIFAGLRVALSVGIVLMVISELYGSTEGLGYFILISGSNFQITDTWSGTLLIGIIGYLLSLALVALDQIVLRWHHLQRSPTPSSARRRSPKPIKSPTTHLNSKALS